MTAEKILEIARGEIGTKEFPADSNRVKYNNAYYGREVSGSNYLWCAVFVWWVFREAGASSLFYGGGKTAYCPTLMSYHKKQAVNGNYQPGDVIFFNFAGKKNAAHVGICESWDGAHVTTIDGNTGSGNEANGGAVLRRRRSKKYIVGAYRPAYQKEENDLTEEQVKRIAQAALAQALELDGDRLFAQYMDRYRGTLKVKPPAMPELFASAMEMGITDGSRPRDLVTREEAAVMARAAVRAAKE